MCPRIVMTAISLRIVTTVRSFPSVLFSLPTVNTTTLTKDEQLLHAVFSAIQAEKYCHEAAVAMRLSWLQINAVHPEDSCPMTEGWGASYELDQLNKVTGGQGSKVDQDARQLLAALMIAKGLKACIDKEETIPLADCLPADLNQLLSCFF